MHFIINGKPDQYAKLVAKPGELLLTNGRRYTFDVIELYMEGPKIHNNLVEVASLAYGSGKWMLGDQPLWEYLGKVQDDAFVQLNIAREKQGFAPVTLAQYASEMSEGPGLHFLGQGEHEVGIARQINSEFFTETYARRWGLGRLLESRGENEGLRQTVCAVAWFEGNYTPVLLRAFSEIKSQQTAEAEAKLRSTQQKLEHTEHAAHLILKEALEKWLRFDPPRMGTDTKARIEKAVKLYVTDSDMHSLHKIAHQFGVTRKTVSVWFSKFTEETGFPVVTHKRHESVMRHLEAAEADKRQQRDIEEASGEKTTE